MKTEYYDHYPTPEEMEIKTSKDYVLDDTQKRWLREWERIEEMKAYLEKIGKEKVMEIGRAPLPTEFGDFTYIIFGDYTSGEHHEVLLYGQEDNITDNMLCRMHSACQTNETYHAVNCECRKELQESLQMVASEGSGLLLYLKQEGRGTGMSGKMRQLDGMFGWDNGKVDQKRDENGVRIDTDRAYKEAGYPSECRDFSVAGEILKRLGIRSVRLLTNNPSKIKGLTDSGIEVSPVGIHIAPDNEIIASDLESKAKNLGHAIPEPMYKYENKAR
jgi:3,4-dihydroxy 2-butanone 4-phosphate synthase / GTP cyclohydrolase II